MPRNTPTWFDASTSRNSASAHVGDRADRQDTGVVHQAVQRAEPDCACRTRRPMSGRGHIHSTATAAPPTRPVRGDLLHRAAGDVGQSTTEAPSQTNRSLRAPRPRRRRDQDDPTLRSLIIGAAVEASGRCARAYLASARQSAAGVPNVSR